jgi:hypothetical protein
VRVLVVVLVQYAAWCTVPVYKVLLWASTVTADDCIYMGHYVQAHACAYTLQAVTTVYVHMRALNHLLVVDACLQYQCACVCNHKVREYVV